jgi:hypothetical protein
MKPFAVIAIYAATGVAAASSPKYTSSGRAVLEGLMRTDGVVSVSTLAVDGQTVSSPDKPCNFAKCA